MTIQQEEQPQVETEIIPAEPDIFDDADNLVWGIQNFLQEVFRHLTRTDGNMQQATDALMEAAWQVDQIAHYFREIQADNKELTRQRNEAVFAASIASDERDLERRRNHDLIQREMNLETQMNHWDITTDSRVQRIVDAAQDAIRDALNEDGSLSIRDARDYDPATEHREADLIKSRMIRTIRRIMPQCSQFSATALVEAFINGELDRDPLAAAVLTDLEEALSEIDDDQWED